MLSTPLVKDPLNALADTSVLRYLLIVLAAAVGGAINSVAGGGTLLTFPALIGLGVPAIVANATSTVALWPGMASSMWGYRKQLAEAGRWAARFAIPSLLGGLTGALLLLITPAARFDAAVPWLVWAATLLFLVQRPAMTALRRRATGKPHDLDTAQEPALRALPPALLAYQYLVGVYGGYFGAGIGILMLAALGFMGFTNIHRMNGLKNWGALCINAVAAITFASSSLVNWPVAASMAVGAIIGGYGGSRLAQRVPQHWVRRAVVAIGAASGLFLLLGRLRRA